MKKIYSFLLLLIIFGLVVLYIRQTVPIQTVSVSQPPTAPAEGETTSVNQELSLDITLPANNSTVNTPSTLVKGTTSPNAEVFVNEKELKADNSGQFSATVALEEGENYILIAANDDLGNYAEMEITVNLETVE